MVLLSPSIDALRTLVSVCERYAEAQGLKYNVSKRCCWGCRAIAEARTDGFHAIMRKRVASLLRLIEELINMHADCHGDGVSVNNISYADDMVLLSLGMCSQANSENVCAVKCFTSSLWVNYTQKAYNALRVQYNDAFRMLLGLPRYCSASGMFAAE
ncbi:uncharacterized protein LOC134741781 [Cydia strobilella]|uniref:uncharacterized protein LOC134741781 n=1 Tax=Cydia strobilella TaxID=1100964 RepID=UPI0030067C41